MTTTPAETRPVAGTLQTLAREYAQKLEAGNAAAAQDMLAAWSDAYWGARQSLDDLVAYVAHARAEGQVISPSWLSRERRLKATLATAKAELDRYAKAGAAAATKAQASAVKAAQANSARLLKQAVADHLPGLNVDLAAINPANLETAVGFLQDGTPLAEHLAQTVNPGAVDKLKQVLTQGLTQGWSQPRMVQAFTQGMAIPHARAVTIMRTESLRVYRETSRQTYAANAHVVETWTWLCAFDARSCSACIAMSGTKHPVTETLDGHPRCRCSMVPNTKSWAELGLDGIPETAPTVPLGTDWLKAQSPAVQRGVLGRAKFDAWKSGELDLPDLVARRYDPKWGTMRAERSLKSIRENRNANWNTLDDRPPPTAPVQRPEPPTPAKPPPGVRVDDLPHRSGAELDRIINDPGTDPFRRQAAEAERHARTAAGQDLPADLPPSKYPATELRKFRDQLHTMDDTTVKAQLTQKDAAVKRLVSDEWDARLRLRAPADLEPADLDRAIDLALKDRDYARTEALLAHKAATRYEAPWDKSARPDTPEEALAKVNPNYATGPEWQSNCTNCTTAYELRRRGFDVTAQSRRTGRSRVVTNGAWGIPASEVAQAERTWLQTARWIETQPEGARGCVSLVWKGGGGHILNWEVVNGRAVFYDAQVGRVYDLAYYRQYAKPHATALRWDDRDVTEALNDFLHGWSVDPT